MNFTSGSLQYQGNLTVGPGGMLGTDLLLTADKTLSNSGTTSVADGSLFTLQGGSLATGNIQNDGYFIFNSGPPVVSSTISNSSIGTMMIGASAVFRAVTAAGTPTPINNDGAISLGGGIAAIAGQGHLTNNGWIDGAGKIAYTIQNTAAGAICANNASRVVLSGLGNTNDGQINLNQGGTVESPNGLQNNPGGVISGDGVLRTGKITYQPGQTPTGPGLYNYGKMEFSGTTKIYGDVWTEGGDDTDIISSGGALLTFFGNVFMRNSGSGSQAPEIRAGAGSRIVYFGTLEGDINLTGSGTHSIEGSIVGNFSNSSNLVFDASTDSSIAGNISGTGSITQQGPGIVTLSGVNTYEGGTTVIGGELLVDNADALPAGHRLSIVGSGTVVLKSGFERAIELSGLDVLASAGAATADGVALLSARSVTVPEPATLGLLGAAAVVLLVLCRRRTRG